MSQDNAASAISVFQKFNLTATPNQHYNFARPVPPGGRFAIVTTRDGIAMDADAAKTSAASAYGEVVWVRRPGAGVKFEGG